MTEARKKPVKFTETRAAVPGGKVSHVLSHAEHETVFGTHRTAMCGRGPIWYDTRGWMEPGEGLKKCARCPQ